MTASSAAGITRPKGGQDAFVYTKVHLAEHCRVRNAPLRSLVKLRFDLIFGYAFSVSHPSDFESSGLCPKARRSAEVDGSVAGVVPVFV